MKTSTLEMQLQYLANGLIRVERENRMLQKEPERLTTAPLPVWNEELLRIIFALSDKESKRIGQDLHDSVLQEQIMNVRLLDTVMMEIEPDSPLQEKLRTLRDGLLDVVYQIRHTCNELRPPMLKEFGLAASLKNLVNTAQLRNDFRVEFTARCHSDWADEVSIAIYRIVQEMLSNATKHSEAAVVKLYLEETNEGVIFLKYEDDGVGCELSRLKHSFQCMGLNGMRGRVHSLGGTIRINSKPGQGMRIWISIPVTADSGRIKNT